MTLFNTVGNDVTGTGVTVNVPTVDCILFCDDDTNDAFQRYHPRRGMQRLASAPDKKLAPSNDFFVVGIPQCLDSRVGTLAVYGIKSRANSRRRRLALLCGPCGRSEQGQHEGQCRSSHHVPCLDRVAGFCHKSRRSAKSEQGIGLPLLRRSPRPTPCVGAVSYGRACREHLWVRRCLSGKTNRGTSGHHIGLWSRTVSKGTVHD